MRIQVGRVAICLCLLTPGVWAQTSAPTKIAENTAKTTTRCEGQPQGQGTGQGSAASTMCTADGAASAPFGSKAGADAGSNNRAAQEAEAAARAERKRRFEAAKARLENSKGTTSEVTEKNAARTGARPALNMTPNYASMLIGEGRRFSLMNASGRHVEDQAVWTSTNPSVVEVTGKAMVVTHTEGTAVIRAQVGMDESEATVKVYPGDSLPPGTHIWEVPLGDRGPATIIPAIPH